MTAMPSTHTPDVLARIRAFLEQHAPAAAGTVLDASTPLLGTGLLDSLAVVQLMVFLGTEFGIEVEDEDFTPENLGTIGSLAAFIERKKAHGG